MMMGVVFPTVSISFILIFSFYSKHFTVYGSTLDNHIESIHYADKNLDACELSTELLHEIQNYKAIADDIIEQIVNGKFAGKTYESLTEFTDLFGPRLTGSQNLENAIDYLVENFKDVGLENVHTESVEVKSRWRRGLERATLIRPNKRTLPMLGLGSSIGTPHGGIVAEVVVVESFSELESMSKSQIEGKIVVFVWQKWEGYEKTVEYRVRAASAAARKGAVGALVRSITPVSIGSPHTGIQHYENNVEKIPVAALTAEDTLSLHRLFKRGINIVIKLEMHAQNLSPAVSRNTIGELQGHTIINTSVVVVSGHIDSWDVGYGAMDDGGGAFISFKAVEFLKKMNYRPKRTIRAILWTGEEQGLIGATEYMKQHQSIEQEEFNFFIESDIGTFKPLGIDFSGNKKVECILKNLLQLLKPINATELKHGIDGGPDISLWVNRGFPGASLLNKNEKYFWYHHSFGDSMIVENPVDLDHAVAVFAVVAYIIADLSIDMPKTDHELN